MHTTEMVKEIYRIMKVPVIVAPPYSWNLMSPEKWHALFKTEELNPTGKAMTKSKLISIC